MLDRGPMGGWLLLPGLFGDIEQAAGLSPEQKFKWSKPGGGLGDFPDAEQDLRQHLVPIPTVVRSHTAEHLLQRLIEPFDQPIGLRVVDGGTELFYL